MVVLLGFMRRRGGAYPWDIYRINDGMVKELLGISSIKAGLSWKIS
jgi:hypothetical protein